MIRALVVDDEEPARRRLKRLLEDAGVTVLGEAEDGVKALARTAALQPDVLFLDIAMPELDGLGVAEALGSTGPRIIFVTTLDDRAVRAFELNALDFLLKPVSAERLAKALERLQAPARATSEAHATGVRAARAAPAGRVGIRCGQSFRVLDPVAIVAVHAQDDYVSVATATESFLADETLESLCARLPGPDFLRVHRSALINITHLKVLVREGDRKFVAVMADPAETRIAVSRERLDELRQRLGLA